jgi:hypothetical protein
MIANFLDVTREAVSLDKAARNLRTRAGATVEASGVFLDRT